MFDGDDGLRKFRKFLFIRVFLRNVFSFKKRFIKGTLRLYYVLHGKTADKILFFIYKNRQSFWLPLLAGITAGLSQPPLYAFFFLPFAVMAFLRLLDFAERRSQLIKISACFNIGYCMVAFYWPAYGTYVFGYHVFLVPIFAVGVILLASLIPTAAFVYFVEISTVIPPFRRIMLFASLWVASEYIRSFVVFKFPFGLLGYALGGVPVFFQAASVFGVLGLSFLLALWAASFYITLFASDKLQFIGYFRTFIIINLSMVFIFALGQMRLNSAKKMEYLPIKAAIIQGNANVGQAKEEIYQIYASLTTSVQNVTNGELDVIVWPESAGVPKQEEMLWYVSQLTYPHQTFIFSETRTDGEDVFNTMYIYNAQKFQFHDKHFLVPYGEYFPIIQKYKFGKAIARGAGVGFSAGKGILPLKTPHGVILPLICYEGTYSGKITRLLKKPHADYIVNITNDEWFGKTAGPYQHFVTAKFRAVEEGLSVVRASNNGFSAFIDPYGRVITKTKLFMQDAIASYIPRKLKDGTLFGVWGNRPVMILSTLIIYYYMFIFKYHKDRQKFDMAFENLFIRYHRKKEGPNYKRRF